MTHTYAVLEVSQATYDEIKAKLIEAGYNHAFHAHLIDMHGIALKPPDHPTPEYFGVHPGA
ncbi:MAG: hypothetical protein M3436_00700 [Pseudomonadota bacterium]|nr:hypothetical protein [Pseudomonadota bacterium]